MPHIPISALFHSSDLRAEFERAEREQGFAYVVPRDRRPLHEISRADPHPRGPISALATAY